MSFRWIRPDEEVIQSRYLLMIEKELAYYRDLFESERSRGDRLNDNLLVRSGEMPVTDLGVREAQTTQQQTREAFEQQQREISEIYGEALADSEMELPEDLQEDARKITEES